VHVSVANQLFLVEASVPAHPETLSPTISSLQTEGRLSSQRSYCGTLTLADKVHKAAVEPVVEVKRKKDLLLTWHESIFLQGSPQVTD